MTMLVKDYLAAKSLLTPLMQRERMKLLLVMYVFTVLLMVKHLSMDVQANVSVLEIVVCKL